ncbi:unnamed protein product, partial [Amoebophrya sp. A25]
GNLPVSELAFIANALTSRAPSTDFWYKYARICEVAIKGTSQGSSSTSGKLTSHTEASQRPQVDSRNLGLLANAFARVDVKDQALFDTISDALTGHDASSIGLPDGAIVAAPEVGNTAAPARAFSATLASSVDSQKPPSSNWKDLALSLAAGCRGSSTEMNDAVRLQVLSGGNSTDVSMALASADR